ncbi:chitosanase [candidate division KSB3 bacterium]|uniref:Chitosanase n=1 Tax=candidate division KSB3 bacterium TaxID=2044937 RepID=A0A2G6E1G5_9BACT|nr:MAG: chitosanase [candidate division KSB3 bacterium]PIE28411.1 MAG: chitosanase [candidate division KSB3 bacterium]
MLTDLQKRAAQAIVNVFETSEPRGNYGKVTILKGDKGHLTYGRSQTTLSSGNLYLLIKAYCGAENAQFGHALRYYLKRLLERDPSLDYAFPLHKLLSNAGSDPVMQEVQDQFFDRAYWDPAVKSAQAIGVTSALGTAVIYDSKVHGSWRRMRDRTDDEYGTVDAIGEDSWIAYYIGTRREWLATHHIPILRKTVYRMDSLFTLIQYKNWDLSLPFHVRGVRIDEGALEPPLPRVSAQEDHVRLLYLKSPYLRGDDVKDIQDALIRFGYDVKVDGIYGRETDEAVKRFQTTYRLKSDGIVGPVTLAYLDIL